MIVAVSMVRDEADIIEGCIRHLRDQGVDRILVADHHSTDGTGEILRGLGVEVAEVDLPGYCQVEMRHRLIARVPGATWVIPFDADELWSAPGTTIAERLAHLDAEVAQAVVYEHQPQATDDLAETDPFRRIVWRSTVRWGWDKVAYRPAPGREIILGAHHVIPPTDSVVECLEIRHFPWRSLEQAERKRRREGEMTRVTGEKVHLAHTVPAEIATEAWWAHLLAPADHLIRDPAPGGVDRRIGAY